MAIVRRKCLSCDKEMDTQQQNKLTCSDTCLKRLQRAITKLRKTLNPSD